MVGRYLEISAMSEYHRSEVRSYIGINTIAESIVESKLCYTSNNSVSKKINSPI